MAHFLRISFLYLALVCALSRQSALAESACPDPVVLYVTVVDQFDSLTCSEVGNGLEFWDVQVMDVIKNVSELEIEEGEVLTVRDFERTRSDGCGKSLSIGDEYVLKLDTTGRSQEKKVVSVQTGEGFTTKTAVSCGGGGSSSGSTSTSASTSASGSGSSTIILTSSSTSSGRVDLSGSRRQLRSEQKDCGKVAVLKSHECAGHVFNPTFSERESVRKECM